MVTLGRVSAGLVLTIASCSWMQHGVRSGGNAGPSCSTSKVAPRLDTAGVVVSAVVAVAVLVSIASNDNSGGGDGTGPGEFGPLVYLAPIGAGAAAGVVFGFSARAGFRAVRRCEGEEPEVDDLQPPGTAGGKCLADLGCDTGLVCHMGRCRP